MDRAINDPTDDLAAAVHHVRAARYRAATLIIPRRIAADGVAAWRGEPRIRRVMAAPPLPDTDDRRLMALPNGGLAGAFARADGVPVLLAPWSILRLPAVFMLLRRGKFSLVCRRGAGYTRVTIGTLALWFIADVALWLTAARGGSRAQGLYRRLSAIAGLRRLWRRMFRRGNADRDPTPVVEPGATPAPDGPVAPFAAVVARAEAASYPPPVTGRVLLVNDGLGPGGAERQLVIAAKALKAAGVHDVTLLTLHMRQDPSLDFFRPDLADAGIPLVLLRHPLSLLTLPDDIMPLDVAAAAADLPPSMLQLVHALVAEFARRRPAVVHAWQDATGTAAGLAALAAGVPRVVLSTRSISPDHFSFLTPFMRPAYQAMLASSRVAMVNNSHAGGASYAAWLGLPQARIAVLHNAVILPAAGASRTSFRRAADLPDDAPVIGSVFRLSEEKQPLLWLDAVLAVLAQRQDAHAVLIGDGPMRDAILARLRGAPDAARFHHFPAWRPAADAIAAFDLFFLASRAEGLPNVVLEAQAAGIPVVATDVGGVAEAVLPGQTAILVAPQDATAERLRRTLLEALDDRALRGRTRTDGPALIARSFAPQPMAARLMQIYGLGGR
jgi:glycosyltransferase involved in cell wall biosynthesis